MTIEEINNIACEIIANAGDSKSYSLEAIEDAESGEFAQARECLEKADESLKRAHEIHTKLLVDEARDPGCISATMMLIHASNHLSVAEISRELSERFVTVYETRKQEVKDV